MDRAPMKVVNSSWIVRICGEGSKGEGVLW